MPNSEEGEWKMVEPEKNIFEKIADSPRTSNILRGVISMMLILGVYFLGYMSAAWTQAQIEEYCHDYNELQCMNKYGGPSDTTNFTFPNDMA